MIKRNVNVDIIRIFSLFMVLLAHTFLNNGYYGEAIDTPVMYIGTYFRQFSMICVPLFIILTGYLHGGKEIEFNKAYLVKLLKVLIPYALVTLFTYFLFKARNVLYGRTLITMLFGFSDNGYTWYIEMYVGLFLLIPFINKGWSILKQKEKQTLIFVTLIVCFIPNVFNSFEVVFPDYWFHMYPLTYYIAGLYMKEYGINIHRKFKLLILLLSTVLLFVLGITVYITYIKNSYNGHSHPLVFVNSVLVFDLLLGLNTEKIGIKLRTILGVIAEAVLPAYMISYVTDIIIYTKIAPKFSTTVEGKIICALPLILLSAFVTIISGIVISVISGKIYAFINKKFKKRS